jgi:hypothetical protein
MESRYTTATFNSSGTWICPAGVTRVIVLGMGGGAGGSAGVRGQAGAGSNGGAGGTANALQPVVLTVVPNTSYSITIGAGGTGGAYAYPTTGKGLSGGDTSFGALMTWKGAPTGVLVNGPSQSFIAGYDAYNSSTGIQASNPQPGVGSSNGAALAYFGRGFPGRIGESALNGSITSSLGGGNGGSGMSGETVGGIGGQGVVNGVGGPGGDALANSGAGGGGGAGGGATTQAGGDGGDGGSGQMIIMWAE